MPRLTIWKWLGIIVCNAVLFGAVFPNDLFRSVSAATAVSMLFTILLWREPPGEGE